MPEGQCFQLPSPNVPLYFAVVDEMIRLQKPFVLAVAQLGCFFFSRSMCDPFKMKDLNLFFSFQPLHVTVAPVDYLIVVKEASNTNIISVGP